MTINHQPVKEKREACEKIGGMSRSESSFKWRVTVSEEFMFLERYDNFDVTSTVVNLLL